jgi:hypothetical protein
MALEVRYVPMKDEGDRDYPKIMKVVYNESGQALSYVPSPLKEAAIAVPSSIEEYFNLVRDYFNDIAVYIDQQEGLSEEVTMKMLEVMTFCSDYVSQNPMINEMPVY